MSTLTFADTHNMIAFLEKPTESDGVHEIIDFLNANQIHYALTVNPVIYTSCIQQFWATAKANIVNGERQLQALIDKKKVIIMESSIRSDLHLEDAGGTDCLTTAIIFEELARMGKGLKGQKEAKTVKNRQGTKETRKRVKKQPKIKAGSADTAIKEVKAQNKSPRTKVDKCSKIRSLFEVLKIQGPKLPKVEK
ncbi:hypothetical protein Tco_1352742 [Tanacetum coccineum]